MAEFIEEFRSMTKCRIRRRTDIEHWSKANEKMFISPVLRTEKPECEDAKMPEEIDTQTFDTYYDSIHQNLAVAARNITVIGFNAPAAKYCRSAEVRLPCSVETQSPDTCQSPPRRLG